MKTIKMVWIVMTGLNVINIDLMVSLLTKLFKNSYSMNFKQAIGDMEVAEDVFKKQKFLLDKSSNMWYNVHVS